MTDLQWYEADEVSLFTLGAMIVRNARRIVWAAVLGGVILGVVALMKPREYVASASFVPQNADYGKSNLSSLAGQLGVSLPAGNESLSPDFYTKLLTSRVLLAAVAQDTFTVPELKSQRITFYDLFDIHGTPKVRAEDAVRLLSGIVIPGTAKSSGIVTINVTTRWPTVSLAIVTKLLDGIRIYNQRIKQGQAQAERQFVEARLREASSDLRRAEDQLEGFLKANRQIGTSPELTFRRDRLQRDVGLRMELFTNLSQAYEDARIREVRDMPVITVFEPPAVSTRPVSRHMLKSAVMGAITGAVIAVFGLFVLGMIGRRRKEGGKDVELFFGSLRDFRPAFLKSSGSERNR